MNGINWPHPDMLSEYESGIYDSGCTEPWIAQILYSLIVAKREPITVLETGGYIGTTTAWLAAAVQEVDGFVVVAEMDMGRAARVAQRMLDHAMASRVCIRAGHDALDVIDEQADGSLGFVWVDDDHHKEHVAAELAALMPKMAPGGIIAMHDVYGVTDLAGLCKQHGGLALDFPRIGPGGGLGLIQI